MSEPVIVFEKVSKTFPIYRHFRGGLKRFLLHLRQNIGLLRTSRHEALKDISFEVQRGETLGVIGRNGAGKSTMLGLMAGILRPTEGKISVKGRALPLLELGGGFHPELTGRENIILNGVLMGLRRKEVLRKMDEIIEFSELGDFVDQPIRMYSSGMLSRLGFSVVAHLEPDIMLVDEILAVGDMSFKEKCVERMMNFKKNGVTMVFVSHFMEDVEWLCDRAMWIEDHQLQAVGLPAEVIEAYSVRQIGRQDEGRARPPQSTFLGKK